MQSVLVCLIMLKVKWALMYPASIGCDKNLIEAAVFGIKTKTLKIVNEKLYKYSKYTKSRTYRVDCGLIHGFAVSDLHFGYYAFEFSFAGPLSRSIHTTHIFRNFSI